MRHGLRLADVAKRRARSVVRGMEASDASRLRDLEAENARLKRIVADQVLDMSAMKELLARNW